LNNYKEMTMANWFDQVTKTLSDKKLDRRQAVKTIAGTVAGVALASYLPETALAKVKKYGCSIQTCGTYTNCPKNSNTNCYCFAQLNGKAGCGCDYGCGSAQACANGSKCPKGYYCSVTCCGTMDCVQKCNQTCSLNSSHVGKTASGR
jgi:hypothetical protein